MIDFPESNGFPLFSEPRACAYINAGIKRH